jgi:UDP-N-acetylmuramoyl-L-alanyl-D-glutamate--2,6-diaminopimelate ligase
MLSIDLHSLLPAARVFGDLPPGVTTVCYDSRQVVRGGLFVAVPGAMPPRSVDGHDFIQAALDAGASVIVVQNDRQAKWQPFVENTGAAFVAVDNTRRALAAIAAAFYGFPARHLTTIGVTGTDGKTTTVHLIAAVLESAGLPTGFLSSVAFKTFGEEELNATHMTTVQSPEVQEALAAMLAAGRRYAVLEASSHGMALNRLDDCEFDLAVFTTLSSDHLDFHGTVEEYLAAKGRLFEMLDESVDKGVPKTAVLNADDPAFEALRSRTHAHILTYAVEGPADFRAENVRLSALGSDFDVGGTFGRQPVSLPLPGLYSVYDALAAFATGLSFGLSSQAVATGLAAFKGVPGRMEMIDSGQPFRVVVDIASTPDALRRILQVLRPLTEGRLIALFGCAGERDPGRRGGMGRVAGELADFSILTNEDPRSEDPDDIIDHIRAGLAEAGRRESDDFTRVVDRRDAIRHAFAIARPGDVVLLAGKATEQSIVIGDRDIPWDERVVARELLAEAGFVP